MWLVRPLVQEDESLSPVFARINLENRLSPQDASEIPFDTRETQTYLDFDKLSHVGAIPISPAADLTKEQARSLTFWQWDARLLPNMAKIRHNFAWLLPLPSRQDEALPLGYSRCPLCLDDDKLPYTRLSHRLAFVVCCPKHEKSSPSANATLAAILCSSQTLNLFSAPHVAKTNEKSPPSSTTSLS